MGTKPFKLIERLNNKVNQLVCMVTKSIKNPSQVNLNEMYFKINLNLIFSKILHLLPLSDRKLILEIIHGVSVILILISLHTANLYLRVNSYYKWVRGFEELLDIFIHTVMTLTNVITVIIATFCHKTLWLNLWTDTKNDQFVIFSSNRSNLYFSLLIVLYAAHTISEYFFYSKYSRRVIVYLIPGFVNIFMLLINSLNMYYFTNNLKDMLMTSKINFEQEKQKLSKIQRSDTNPYIVSQVFAKISKMDEHLQYFIKMCKKIHSFNKIYGLQILLFATVFLLFAYENLNVALKEGFNQPTKNNSQFKLSFIKLLKCCSFLVIIISFTFWLSISFNYF